MNQKNYEYLKEQLKNTGFGESLQPELANKISQGAPEFSLDLKQSFGQDTGFASLHFKKGANSDMYFFNRYDLQVQDGKDENKEQQSFYINKGSSITLKEAYNLLEGRSVHKTLTSKQNEKYDAWIQLNKEKTTENGNYEIKQYHQNYGYNLESTLAKYPIKELADDKAKEQLIRSLQRGNLQAATFSIAGKEERLFITPNVAFKTLSAFNTSGQRVSLKDFTQQHKKVISDSEAKNDVETKQQPGTKQVNHPKQPNDKNTPKRRKKQSV